MVEYKVGDKIVVKPGLCITGNGGKRVEEGQIMTVIKIYEDGSLSYPISTTNCSFSKDEITFASPKARYGG